MRKNIIVILITICALFPVSIFAGGKKETCKLTIVNDTGNQITQIMVKESEADDEPEIYNINLEPKKSAKVNIKKTELYDIVLIRTDERHYLKKRQTWDKNKASVTFTAQDLQSQSTREIWSKKASDLGKKIANAGIFAGKAVKSTLGELYKQMGGSEGLQKAVKVLGKFSVKVLKFGVKVTIEAGKVIVEVSKYAMEQIEKEKKQKLNASDRQLLDEYIEFVIVEDDELD